MSDTREQKVKITNLAVMKVALEKAGFETATNATVQTFASSVKNVPLAFKVKGSGPLRMGFKANQDKSYSLFGDLDYIRGSFKGIKARSKEEMNQITKRIEGIYNLEAILEYAQASGRMNVESHTPFSEVFSSDKMVASVEIV